MRSVAEGVVEHFAEARLEDVEREEGVREKRNAGEGHDRDGGRQWNSLGHRRR